MKIRIIPDLHGETWWEDFKDDNVDKFIFLGDYVDSYTISDKDIVDNLLKLIEFKKNNTEKVVLLYGNHEYNYCHPYIGYCSGYRASYSLQLQEILKDNKDLFSVIYELETPSHDLLFSHAGLSKGWIIDNYYWLNSPKYDLNYHLATDSSYKGKIEYDVPNLDKLLNIGIESKAMLDRIMSIGYMRGGASRYGGPLWADMSETYNNWYKENGKPLIQIVGHTPQKHLTPHTYKNNNSYIAFLDLNTRKVDYVLDISDKITLYHNNKEIMSIK